jgi:hypothetical protein
MDDYSAACSVLFPVELAPGKPPQCSAACSVLLPVELAPGNHLSAGL